MKIQQVEDKKYHSEYSVKLLTKVGITAFEEILDFGLKIQVFWRKILKKNIFVGFFQNFFEKNQ